MKPTRQVLIDAIDVLERQGWYQGNYTADGCHVWETDGPVCMLGAIMKAADARYYTGDRVPAIEFVNQWFTDHPALGVRPGASHARPVGPVHWQDAKGRTLDEVKAKLREMAEGVPQ